MQILPDREQLSSRFKWLWRGFLGFVSLVILASVLLFVFYLTPWYLDAFVRQHYVSNQIDVAWRQFYKIRDAILVQFDSHAEFLIQTAGQISLSGTQLDSLEEGARLPDVIDVFWYDNRTDSLVSLRGRVTRSNIHNLQYKVLRMGKLYKGYRPFLAVGYKRVALSNEDALLVFRDVRLSEQTDIIGQVGLAIPFNRFRNSVAPILDSLYDDDDSNSWEDNPSRQKENYGRAYGVLLESDTLWWWGDKSEPIFETLGPWDTDEWRHSGIIYLMDGVGLKIEIRAMLNPVVPEIRRATILLARIYQVGTVLVLLALIALVYSIILIRKRSRRNQIALAHLAHAVKTPVARLKLAAETFTEGRVASPEEERLLMKAVGRESDRLDRAVKNAALSLEKGRRTFELVEGDLAGVVREIAESWKPAFDQAGIGLKVEVMENLKVRIDAEMVGVMVDNLIDNALRHTRMKGEGSVTISLRSEAGSAILTVDDSGAGIPKSQRGSIFKLMGHSAVDPRTGAAGLGLGLALVKEIAEGHKGKVEVVDSSTGGARFVVRLPI